MTTMNFGLSDISFLNRPPPSLFDTRIYKLSWALHFFYFLFFQSSNLLVYRFNYCYYLRLDHFLLNKKVTNRLVAATADKHVRGWQGSSDHAPVWIELAEQDAPRTKNKTMKKETPTASFLDPAKDSQTVKVDGCPLAFNHLSKVYWPEDGITKRDMFNYYDQVAEYMMPYLKDRPMSLNRFPNGIHGPSFYQKNVKDKAPDCMATMPHTNDKGEEKEYLVATNKASLLWMASLGCIEINPWFSRVQSPDNPDFCVIDFDPDKQHFD
jgi:hypothetical protein